MRLIASRTKDFISQSYSVNGPSARPSMNCCTIGFADCWNVSGVPSSTMRPWSSMISRSEIASALRMSWVTTIDGGRVERAVHLHDQFGDDVADDRIEAGGRLVEQQDLRF